MSEFHPQCCNPAAFGLLARHIPMLDSPDSLLQGAVAIAMHKMPQINRGAIDLRLQDLADTVRNRVRGGQQQALLAHLHEVLFVEEGFEGNSNDYYNPANSFLPVVLKTKRGLPITLSLIYKSVAERLGIRAWGVGLPGHFIMAVEQAGTKQPMLVDCFSKGRILTADEAHDRMKELLGDEAEWSEDVLRPASNRHWLTRMLQNLLHIYSASNHYSDVAAMLELEMLLWPNQAHLQRDLALVLARIGMAQPASLWLGEYLRNNPDDPQGRDLKQLLDVLKA